MIPGFAKLSIGRKVAYSYAAAALVMLGVLALRAPTLEFWFWRAVMLLLFLGVSLRSALIWSYRRNPSRLNWLLRPSIGEHEFTVMWLVYAVVFGGFTFLLFFI
jgi:nitrate/nitrite transporter NarK